MSPLRGFPFHFRSFLGLTPQAIRCRPSGTKKWATSKRASEDATESRNTKSGCVVGGVSDGDHWPNIKKIADGVASYSLTLLAVVLLAGCGERIDKEYGRRTGFQASASVNGTAVLVDMVEQAGHDVSVRRRLGDAWSDKTNVIVWTPDDHGVLQDEPREWLIGWLRDKPDRVLVYVGRDFDAAPLYWQWNLSQAPADQADEVQDRLDSAKREFAMRRSAFPDDEDCGWYVFKGTLKHRKVNTLAGPWSEGVDAAEVGIELNGRLEKPTWAEQEVAGYEVLLESSGDMLVSRQRFESWDGSQLIVVANGSFLLNLPLVNHEHRKLAGKLIDEFPFESQVVFLESGVAGLQVGEAGSLKHGDADPRWMRFARIALLHMAVLLTVFCLSRWPIFGRPLEPKVSTQGDFGKHITALGKLLMMTRDVNFARTRILNYRRKVRPDKKTEIAASPTTADKTTKTIPARE